jgi:hypothetical protein
LSEQLQALANDLLRQLVTVNKEGVDFPLKRPWLRGRQRPENVTP